MEAKTERIKERVLTYQGNTVRAQDPFMFFPDPRVPMCLCAEKGEYVFWRNFEGRHQLLKEQVEAVLDSLTGRERRVLQLRFGLEDGRARTLEEVGKEFNVTRERIRQIEAKALRKLRHPSRSRKLKDYLE